MKKIFRRIEKTILFLVKLFMFAGLCGIFFWMFYYEYPFMFDLSRTTAITYSTFIVSGVLFIRIYGGFAIGEKKDNEIINSLALATLMCDLTTFFSLSIMTQELTLQNIGVLILIYLAQLIIIITFTWLGNFIYFKLFDPEPCLVVYGNPDTLPASCEKLKKYRKQWCVSKEILYDDADIKREIRAHKCIFLFDVPATERNAIIEYSYKHNKNIHFTPDVSDIITKHAQQTMLDDMAVFSSASRGLTFEQLFIKRVSDIVFSALSLAIAAPVMIIEAIIIRICDGSPVMIKQERMTRSGRVFMMYKFRTMVTDAEKDGATPSYDGDPRITRVGRFLRRYRLDELPNFFNIFMGDMSFVGPRPEQLEIAKEYEKDMPEYKYRLKVKAGLTGIAQISGKYNTSPRDKLTLDLLYIERYSVWIDLLLLLQTFKVLLKSDSTEGFKQDDSDIS
ncbi:MAG: exopolysaccharide biosynthesis polyprenyl glycosylphosphotransferase [Oscillospiraceae bacterium]|nr:exopolysaccharide biosynthesis polyprenyl glycosylphosphotransferase [Oscillospiraceae bacterium]